MSVRLSAPAKINWFLEITGKRPDGYHTLSTVFQTISLADRLSLAPAGDLSLTCSDKTLPTDERNLVMRAARRLRERLNEKRGAHLHLEKRVPMGAGLGGGSSDAAAALMGLCRLWKRRVPRRDLEKLAVGLGADVPFFLRGGRCWATGIGERLKPLAPLRKTWLVLVYPGFGVSTREAYARVRLPARRQKWRSHSCPRFNRFEEFVFPQHPELIRLKEKLTQACGSPALMSGSGSSVFASVSSLATGRRALRSLRSAYPQSWLVHTL